MKPICNERSSQTGSAARHLMRVHAARSGEGVWAINSASDLRATLPRSLHSIPMKTLLLCLLTLFPLAGHAETREQIAARENAAHAAALRELEARQQAARAAAVAAQQAQSRACEAARASAQAEFERKQIERLLLQQHFYDQQQQQATIRLMDAQTLLMLQRLQNK